MNQSLNKMAAAVFAMLCTVAVSSVAEAQTRHQLKLSLPGLAVSGAAEAPASQQLQLSSTAIDFGEVATHTTVKRQVLAANIGGATLSFKAAPAVTGSEAFNAGLTSCGATLPVGAECLAEVLFSPTSVGAHSGLLSFTTSLADSPHKVSLAANAFNPVSLAAATLPEGRVGQAYTYDFKPLLGVSNEASPNKSLATWSGTGTLPSGLSFNSSTGVLSGTPTTPASAGTDYTVVATYKNNQGQQAYTLRIGSIYLEAVQISAGGYHTCAVTPSGGVQCWGYNSHGQLGDGTTTTRPTPTAVVGLTTGVVKVVAGDHNTCAITTAGALKCWGRDDYGQLGDDITLANKSTPVAVAGLNSGVASVAVGGLHTCAVTTAGALKCWGRDDVGQLGNDTALANRPTPTAVAGLSSGVASVGTGGGHTCATTTLGELKCWGYNVQGQLGDGTTTSRATPTAVVGLTSGVASVALGGYHTCAVTPSGGVKCWGYNSQGQLGDNTTDSRATPVDAWYLASGVKSVTAGGSHTCAVTSAGAAKCWGQGGYGQIGDGASVHRFTPENVFGLSSGVAALTAGGAHTCAAKMDGEAKCWGYDAYGQLGNDNALVSQPQPVNVAR